jgi:membrane protease YdiL (CAAX protease family)
MPLSLPPEPQGAGLFRSDSPGPVLIRVFLFLVLVVAFSSGFGSLAGSLGLIGASTGFAAGLLTSECTRGAGTLLAAWVMSRLEERKLGDYGLPWRAGEGKRFALGAFFGIVEISAVMGVLAAFGYYSFGSVEIHGAEFLKWVFFWAVTFLAVGFFEEYAFRGYAQFALTRGFGFWAAAVTTSLLFGGVHMFNPGESWPGIAGVVVVGIFWCFTVRRTGTLWFALGMHAAFDFGETFVFSVPDSGAVFPGHLSSAVIHPGPAWLVGGSAGPEASILDFAMLAIFFYVVHRMYPAKAEPTDDVRAVLSSADADFLSSSGADGPRDTLDSSIH